MTDHRTSFKALCWGAMVGGFAAFMYCAPAYWAASVLSRASQGRVLLIDPQGSLWRGNAQLALSSGLGGTQATALPGRIEWQLHWTHWSTAEIDVWAPCCMAHRARTQLSWNWPGLSIALGDAEIHWSAQWLQALGAPWNTVQLLGELAFKSLDAQVNLKDKDVSLLGQVQLSLHGLSSRLSTVKPLGSYLVVISGSPTLGLNLTTMENSRLILKGMGQWKQGRLHFDGVAQTAAGDENTLSNLLNVLGQRRGNEAHLHFE